MRRMFKPPKDPRGGHLRIYWDVFDSPAWASLSASSRLAYLALLRQKGSTNNGDLSLPLGFAQRHGISSSSTLAKALRELGAVGLIAVTRQGGCVKGGQRLPTLYRFTDTEVYANPVKHIEASKPTNDWKTMTTPSRCHEAILCAEEIAAAAETKRKAKSLLRKSALTSSKAEAVSSSTTSKIEAGTFQPIQNSKLASRSEMVANPTPVRVSS